ncbi:HU domain-containing protein [Mucilaginibacter glaciei]|uniref:CCDC81-like prokaryotic HU domain-containing protein n=1 Tax=Mucilaginibacter glaciei TaxID=2772109 RepID=A0A926S546_9SPHI|nr:hypothetical protein [Mucilaginibacter glaciei]MBD1392396.1 hypothetical protein [Mucilaginibacter glaciei]
MDVGYFISELLGQHGDVMVPGLGYFAHTRVNGYYNQGEGRFYPPGYSVQFDPQFIDDDTLAQYIADNKNISLASSKYFTEKYVANVRYLASTGEAAIANLGWFFTQDFKLVFRSNNEVNTDADFFGFPALIMYKLGARPGNLQHEEVDEPIEVPSQQMNPPEADVPQFETDREYEAYLVELTAKRKRKTLITFVILAVLLTGMFYFLYTKYDKSIFNLEEKKPIAKNDSVAAPKKLAVVKDSAKRDMGDDSIEIVRFNKKETFVAQRDTAKPKKVLYGVTPPAVTDTIKGQRFEILGGSFGTAAQAKIAVGRYLKMGFDAKVLENVPGRRVKVTLGTFATSAEAKAAEKKILATGKVKPAELYVQPYNVK